MHQDAICGVETERYSCYDFYGVLKSPQLKAQHLLALNVRSFRENLGWTQEQAAETSGIAVRHYQKIESGDVNVTVGTLVRVANAFRVSVGDLFDEAAK